MLKLLLAPLNLLVVLISTLVGRVKWTPPSWARWSYRKIISNKMISFVAVLLIAVSFAGYYYVDSLPKKVKVIAHVFDLKPTPQTANAKPSTLYITFTYDYDSLNEDQVRPSGVPSVAKIDLVGKEIESGLTLSPKKEGTWRWVSDNNLVFTPQGDWPVGTEYTVTMQDPIFTNTTILSERSYEFKTPELEAEFSAPEFYQDPTDSSIRRVISTLSFSHPVDKESLEANLSMGLQPDSAEELDQLTPHEFSVSYSKDLRKAYINSASVALPESPNYMTLKLGHGVKSILGGTASRQARQAKVLIPDVYSYLKVSNASVNIIRNTKNEPEQIITLEFTDEINERELLKKFSVYQLANWSRHGNHNLKDRPRLITDEDLASSPKLELRLIPNERNTSKIFNFKIDTPETSNIYLLLESGLTSVNKFVYGSFYDNVLRTPRYPKEVSIMGEGAILSHSGNHQLSVLTRGLPTLKYSVGKLVEGRINHLVSQTYGDITNPTFSNWRFNKHDISEGQERIVDLQKSHPKQANYSSLDLTEYLPNNGGDFGLFFIEVQGWDKPNNRATGPRAERLVLITDLGIIVKDNADQSHHVFVQSIANGEPVVGAQVQLLGRNGLPIASTTTDQRGQAFFASTYGYQDEKTPTVYLVKTEKDTSFIPFQRSERQLNLSKFDVSGVHLNAQDDLSLNAYMFSDRGIYRPGETVNLGNIVKNEDLSNVEGVPLELVITGPRYQELKVERYQLPRMGFSDFQFNTTPSSDTGQYTASVHLVSNYGHRGQHIGSTQFKVEEFEPDTMRIESKIKEASATGWSTANKLNAAVSLSNLFGTPAQDRKVTASVLIEPEAFNFAKFSGYQFSEIKTQENTSTVRLNQEITAPRTNNDGKTNIEIDLSKFQRGTYRARLFVEGFTQDGGRSVQASNSIRTSPLTQLIGYKADGDLGYINENSQRRINYIAIDNDLEKQQATNLSLKLIEIQHVSTLVKQDNGTYQYQSIKKEVELSNESVTIAKEGLNYDLDTQRPGDFALELYDTEQQRLSRLEYTVAGFANLTGKIDKNAELQLKLNKQDYRPGETIELSLKAPYVGAGLITIESNKVHAFKWFKTDQESTVQQIELPTDIEGTGYINVSFVRDVSSNEIFTSPLSYAVKPFSIDTSKRRVDITLEADDLVRPGKAMDIKFSTSRPSKIAVFAVDEGILQVAKYQTPNPLSHYLKKRALGVETLQILDLILPDFDIVKQLSASGGGSQASRALAKNLNPFRRKTDKPAVFWSGIYDASEVPSSIEFDVPNSFAGELRIMAVAVAEEAVGAHSQSTTVRGPFVISPNVLNAAAPSDEFGVTVGVANIIKGSGKNVPITVSIKSSNNLEVVGESSSVLNIDEGSEGKLTFKVKALQALGAAELTFTASHKNETLYRTAGLSVRPAVPYRTEITSGVVDNGALQLNNLRTLYPDLAKQTLSASASPLVIVDGLTSYLESYPHGCTEQIVSKVFPIIGLLSNELYAPHQSKVNNQFDRLISQLRRRQSSDGGFTFWPSANASAIYPTVYAMHFLIDAKEAGYSVPSDMLEQGLRFLTGVAQRQSGNSVLDARNRANAIYLLTRTGVVTTNYLVDLEESLQTFNNKDWHASILPSYMAATYQLLQKDNDANRLIEFYKLAKHSKTRLDDFNSPLAMQAQHLYLLSKHFPERAKQIDSEVILSLTDKINRGDYNTISSAYSVLALGEYSKLALPNKTSDEIEFIASNIEGARITLTAQAKPFSTVDYDTNVTKLSATSDQGLFYINSQAGFDRQATTDVVKEGIEVFREFVNDDGEVVTRFEQGKEITVKLKVRALNNGTLSNIALVDLLPGGFEVIRQSVPRTAHNWSADYVDVREDRVVYYGSFGSSITELSYRVKLTSSGRFVVPSTYAESMYDNTVRAISKSGYFDVTASQ